MPSPRPKSPILQRPSTALDHAFAALADPTRRAILARLSLEGATTARQLAQPFPISQPALWKHLKVLEDAGLIRRTPGRRLRVARALARENLVAAAQWLAGIVRDEAAEPHIDPQNRDC